MKLGGIRANTITRNDAAKAKAAAEAEQLRGVLAPMAAAGMSLAVMAQALAGAGRKTRNGSPLSPTQVSRILQRLELVS